MKIILTISCNATAIRRDRGDRALAFSASVLVICRFMRANSGNPIRRISASVSKPIPAKKVRILA